LRIAALNAERLADRAAVRGLMTRAGAHATLLSEVDLGMARSGNVHNLRELTAGSGEGYLYGVEFVELDLGSEDEIRRHAGARNAAGLHGNWRSSRASSSTRSSARSTSASSASRRSAESWLPSSAPILNSRSAPRVSPRPISSPRWWASSPNCRA
jgi:hypothetical protein